jgi:hypothetical protein
MTQILQARAPGVTVMPGGGNAGSASRIVLRGPGSLSQSIEPLIYVDGVRIDNSKTSGTGGGGGSWTGLDDINPEDIERVEIIKGASAATMYGSEAFGRRDPDLHQARPRRPAAVGLPLRVRAEPDAARLVGCLGLPRLLLRRPSCGPGASR